MIWNSFSSKNGFLILLVGTLLAGFLFNATAYGAQTSGETTSSLTGRDLAQKVFDRDTGRDATARVEMVLLNKRGKKRVRTFDSFAKHYGSLIRQVIRFTTPADIKGTAFLSVEKSGGGTQQFLYLPALRRARRIVTSQKSHRFVNSDFTYEDMERRPVDDSQHTIAGEEKRGPLACYVLESRPKKGTPSQYSLVKSWIAKKIFVPVYMELFDKKGMLAKKYTVLRLEKRQGIWTEMQTAMEDLTRKHSTALSVETISYNTGLEDRLFTDQGLGKW